MTSHPSWPAALDLVDVIMQTRYGVLIQNTKQLINRLVGRMARYRVCDIPTLQLNASKFEATAHHDTKIIIEYPYGQVGEFFIK